MLHLKTLKDRIKEIREHQGLTQQLLAERCKIDRTTLTNIERGRAYPSLKVLCKLADILDMTTDYLLGRELSWKEVQNDK